MPVEIERKFLVTSEAWRPGADKGVAVRQAYLASTGNASVRVRVEDGRRATLTTKLPRSGRSRFEYENEIALHEAETLMELGESRLIEKTRYRVPSGGLVWEIDVFGGQNRGLVIAEIELTSEDQHFTHPAWLGREVTGDARYQNSNLAAQPYKKWRTRPAAPQLEEHIRD